jgi:hypothetical protein
MLTTGWLTALMAALRRLRFNPLSNEVFTSVVPAVLASRPYPAP